MKEAFETLDTEKSGLISSKDVSDSCWMIQTRECYCTIVASVSYFIRIKVDTYVEDVTGGYFRMLHEISAHKLSKLHGT